MFIEAFDNMSGSPQPWLRPGQTLKLFKSFQALPVNWVGMVRDISGRTLVIKVMDKDEVDKLSTAQQSDWNTRMQKEIATYWQLSNTFMEGVLQPIGIAKIRGIGLGLLLPVAAKGNLADILVQYHRVTHPEDRIRDALIMGRGILQGVANINSKGIVLCDGKTENVLIDGNCKPMYADLNGIVKMHDPISTGLFTLPSNYSPEKAAAVVMGVPMPATAQMDTWTEGITLCAILGVALPWAHLLPVPGQPWDRTPLDAYMAALFHNIGNGTAAMIMDVHRWPQAHHLPHEAKTLLTLCFQPNAALRHTPAQVLQFMLQQQASLPDELPIDSPLRQVIEAMPNVDEPQQQPPASRWTVEGGWATRLQAMEDVEEASMRQAHAEATTQQALMDATLAQGNADAWQAAAEDATARLAAAEETIEGLEQQLWQAETAAQVAQEQAAAEAEDLHRQAAGLVEMVKRQAATTVEEFKMQAATRLAAACKQAAERAAEEAKRQAAAEVEQLRAKLAAAEADASYQRQLAEHRLGAVEHLKEELGRAEGRVEAAQAEGRGLLRELEHAQWLLHEKAEGGAVGEVVALDPVAACPAVPQKEETAKEEGEAAFSFPPLPAAPAPVRTAVTPKAATDYAGATMETSTTATSSSGSRPSSSDGGSCSDDGSSSPLAPCTPLRHSSTGFDAATATTPFATAAATNSGCTVVMRQLSFELPPAAQSAADAAPAQQATAAVATPSGLMLPQLRSKKQLQTMLRRHLLASRHLC